MYDIYTIGHSNYSQNQFITMLNAYNIEEVIDIRAFRTSKRHTQYNEKVLKQWLGEAKVEYCVMPNLGGRRTSSDTIGRKINEAWKNESFHNYADYSLTETFQEGIKALQQLASHRRVAIMCAESHPARCHRLIISNWLGAHNWKVYHIMLHHQQNVYDEQHELGKWGAMPIIETDGQVVYPMLNEK
ncbi:DUF488 family protein [Staphylococcus nepalensis]|uniref:Uncharacterized conserved protein n=1 Tax=Staphylococcus nepalensis TaxID=214473 RepID=A0A380GIX6_9STAP|nr:DUF488 domain-containing protein [Staphylococcus nepalensis]PNZ98991.1 DNA repair protein [Staphylococcus nepalensis]GGB77034.1 hypothetical protein GCM10007203_05160 [Staphylococcus nepalensis]SUM54029.1 Uncharacterized conserved protein [Staphylococcus nepalensis]VDG65962.1 Uncharacterized conserved protein [Lacrimispora indolis]